MVKALLTEKQDWDVLCLSATWGLWYKRKVSKFPFPKLQSNGSKNYLRGEDGRKKENGSSYHLRKAQIILFPSTRKKPLERALLQCFSRQTRTMNMSLQNEVCFFGLFGVLGFCCCCCLLFFKETNWQGFPDTSYTGKRGQPRATGVEPTTSKQTLALGTYPNWVFKGSYVALLFSLNLV